MSKSWFVLLCLSALSGGQGRAQTVSPPWTGGVGTLDGSFQEAVLIWSPHGDLHCLAVKDGRLTAWKAADGDGLRFQPVPLDAPLLAFTACRTLTAYRRRASDWLVFFIATADGREGLYAAGFGDSGALTAPFLESFDPDTLAGPIGQFEVRRAEWDAFAVFCQKGGRLGFSRVERGSLAIRKDSLTPSGMRVDAFVVQGVPKGEPVEFLGAAAAYDGGGTRGLLLFDVRGAYPGTCDFLEVRFPSEPVGARMLADREGIVTCVIQNGTDVRLFRRGPGAWADGGSFSIPADDFLYLPLLPPMREGAFVLSSTGGGDALHALARDTPGGTRLDPIVTDGSPGSIRIIPLDCGTLLIGWNGTSGSGFRVLRLSLIDGCQTPIGVPMPEGHRVLDAALTADGAGVPQAVVVSRDDAGAWVHRFRWDAAAGRFAKPDLRSLAAEDLSGFLPIVACESIGKALVLSGASGLFVLDGASETVTAFPGRGRIIRGTDGSAYLLLSDRGGISVICLRAPDG